MHFTGKRNQDCKNVGRCACCEDCVLQLRIMYCKKDFSLPVRSANFFVSSSWNEGLKIMLQTVACLTAHPNPVGSNCYCHSCREEFFVSQVATTLASPERSLKSSVGRLSKQEGTKVAIWIEINSYCVPRVHPAARKTANGIFDLQLSTTTSEVEENKCGNP